MLLTTLLMLKQRTIVQVFARAAAVSADQARSADELGLRVGVAWQQLASHGVLRSPASGRWFLDRGAWRQLCRRRLAWIVAALAGVLLIWLLMWSLRWR